MGARVKFRHDEIRDYKDNIRLDYGYAMTIASAQGLTVDRTFLLADDRPGTGDHLSRRDPPPRGSRHLCQPGTARLRHRRPAVRGPGGTAGDGQRHQGASSRALVALAAQGGGARLHVSDGAWRERQDDPRRHVGGSRWRTGRARPKFVGRRTTKRLRASQDEIRHAVIGWRHGAAVDAFAAERSEVLAAWGELRERTRAEGGTVALSPAFRETLDRHAALLKRASPFRTRPRTFERLLGERAGIGKQDLDEFEALHARAGKYRRAAMLKTAQALREENGTQAG